MLARWLFVCRHRPQLRAGAVPVRRRRPRGASVSVTYTTRAPNQTRLAPSPSADQTVGTRRGPLLPARLTQTQQPRHQHWRTRHCLRPLQQRVQHPEAPRRRPGEPRPDRRLHRTDESPPDSAKSSTSRSRSGSATRARTVGAVPVLAEFGSSRSRSCSEFMTAIAPTRRARALPLPPTAVLERKPAVAVDGGV
jgi:hypothetical protein